MSVRSLTVVCLVALRLGAGGESSWSYHGATGPDSWSERYPMCGGSRQSPIDIRGGHKTSWPRISWHHYDSTPLGTTLQNNGEQVLLTAQWNSSRATATPHLKIVDHSGRFQQFGLHSVHFHWGRSDREGSEHTFNGRRFPLELHAVHTRLEDGRSVEYAVMTYLFQISELDNPALDLFLLSTPRVMRPNSSLSLPPFPWTALLPRVTSHVFVYRGSLTSPPCSQTATFYVSAQLRSVSRAQMKLFRILVNKEGKEMSGNHRPVQPLNDRRVFYVVQEDERPSSSRHLTLQFSRGPRSLV